MSWFFVDWDCGLFGFFKFVLGRLFFMFILFDVVVLLLEVFFLIVWVEWVIWFLGLKVFDCWIIWLKLRLVVICMWVVFGLMICLIIFFIWVCSWFLNVVVWLVIVVRNKFWLFWLEGFVKRLLFLLMIDMLIVDRCGIVDVMRFWMVWICVGVSLFELVFIIMDVVGLDEFLLNKFCLGIIKCMWVEVMDLRDVMVCVSFFFRVCRWLMFCMKLVVLSVFILLKIL